MREWAGCEAKVRSARLVKIVLIQLLPWLRDGPDQAEVNKGLPWGLRLIIE